VALRSLHGDGPGYLQWRLDAFDLDRHATEPGRRKRVEAALREAEGRPSLRISGQ
jgi:hypothetical protein